MLKIFLYGPDDESYEFRTYPFESALLNSTTVSMLMNKQHILQIKLWQYGLWSFQMGGIKLEIFLPKNQHTQRKFLNFENWTNREPQ